MDRDRALHVGGVVLLAVVLVPFVVHAVPGVIGGDASYVVLSGSMEPAISAGDVIVVEETQPSELEEGDVVTFEPPAGHDGGGSDRITHRVIEVVREDGQLSFRTKGDANEEPDGTLVPAENVEGRVTLTIPLVGHLILFAGSRVGLLLLVVVPAGLLAVNETWMLWQAATGGDGGGSGDD